MYQQCKYKCSHLFAKLNTKHNQFEKTCTGYYSSTHTNQRYFRRCVLGQPRWVLLNSVDFESLKLKRTEAESLFTIFV